MKLRSLREITKNLIKGYLVIFLWYSGRKNFPLSVGRTIMCLLPLRFFIAAISFSLLFLVDGLFLECVIFLDVSVLINFNANLPVTIVRSMTKVPKSIARYLRK